MEYRNNWPVYIQGRQKHVKAEVDGNIASEVCVGSGKKQAKLSKLDVALARAECNKTAKVEGSTLQIDVLMAKLVYLQRSSNQTTACRARKAAAELASERKRLAFMCERLKKLNVQDVREVMTVENRKALAVFRARWANLLGGV